MRMKNASPVCEYCGHDERQQNYAHQLPVGTVLNGQYLVGRVLGQGGFGITYMGWDLNLAIPIAIKEYYPSGTVSRECSHSLRVTGIIAEREAQFRRNRERFIQEARTLARLRSVPGIVGIHNFFQENDTAYIVMEYLDGTTLRKYTELCGGRVVAYRALELMQPVMLALQQVHAVDLVHRDISPDNIMLMLDGSLKLLDFGASREVVDADVDKNLARSTEAILKHGFAPMEQYQKRGTLGPWTDVYALCATIYYLLTGSVPPDAPERMLEGAIMDWRSIPGLTPRQINALERGSALLPKERIGSVAELYRELYAPSAPARGSGSSGGGSGTKISGTKNSSGSATGGTKNGGGIKTGGTKTRDDTKTGGKGKKFLPALLFALAAAAMVVLLQPRDAKPQPAAPAATEKPALVASRPEIPDVQEAESPEGLSLPEDWERTAAARAGYTYHYRDGSYIEKYFDAEKNEILRLYFDKDGKLTFRSAAVYSETGNMLLHGVYDGSGKLLREDRNSFDAEGNALKRECYLEGILHQTTEYVYRANGKCEYAIQTLADGRVSWETTYVFDESTGLPVSSTRRAADGSVSKTDYNSEGKSAGYTYWDTDGTWLNAYLYEYDDQGRTASTITLDADGNQTGYSRMEYDGDGNRLRETWYTKSGAENYSLAYTYDPYGDQLTYSYRSSDGYQTESEYVTNIQGGMLLAFGATESSYSSTTSVEYYNAMGRVEYQESFNADGSPESTYRYHYDAYGNQEGADFVYYYDDGRREEGTYDRDYRTVAAKWYSASGVMEKWLESETDSDGNVIRTTTWKADGTRESTEEYLYDENGSQTGRAYTYYQSDGGYTVSIYDQDYNILESITYDAGGNVRWRSTYEYEYDANGNKIRQLQRDETGTIQSWTEYIYDENGNMVDSEWHNGAP